MATVISHLPARSGAAFTASTTHLGAKHKGITLSSIRVLRVWLRALTPAFVAPHPAASRTEHVDVQRASTGADKHTARSREVQAAHELAQAHTMTLVEPLGHALVCLAGCVWITQDGDPRDIVISAGQVFTPDRNRHTLIHALEASLVRVARPAR